MISDFLTHTGECQKMLHLVEQNNNKMKEIANKQILNNKQANHEIKTD